MHQCGDKHCCGEVLMKNIFVTGVSGYLGARLTEALVAKDGVERMVGVDIVPLKKPLSRCAFFKMDIRDPSMGDTLREYEIDTLVHLAFVVQPIHDLKRMHDIDYNGTKNVLEQAQKAGVRHVVAVSSTLAYGAHPDNPIELQEDDPLRGNKHFPYGHEKAVVDRMIQAFAESHPEMTITILRPCTVFGPSVDNYVSRMLFRPFSVRISGSDTRIQFVHEDDFVRACIIAIEKKIGGAFNIAGEGVLTAADITSITGCRMIPLPASLLYPLVEILWRLRFPGMEVNRGYLDYARYSFVASPEKAKQELGFYPIYSSREVLEETRGRP